jgi:hypothetical protein
MRVLKTILSVLICSAFGIGLGTGIFYLQQYLATKKPTTITTSATATPSPTPVQGSTYTSSDSNISYVLPKNTVVLESELSDLGSQNTGSTQELYSLNASTNSLTDTGTQITILTSSSTSPTALTSAIAKIEKVKVNNRLLSQTLESTTTSGLAITKKSYLGTVGGADTLATITTDGLYILVYTPSTNTISDADISTLLSSIKQGTAPTASASPSALLNTSNE